MNKRDAINIFGSGAALARAIGVTRSAISQWPEVLEQAQADRVMGAAFRLGLLHKMPVGRQAADGKAVSQKLAAQRST